MVLFCLTLADSGSNLEVRCNNIWRKGVWPVRPGGDEGAFSLLNVS